MRKLAWLKYLGLFVLAVALTAYGSLQYFRRQLPLVETGGTISAGIRRTQQVLGAVRYSEKVYVRAYAPATVVEVYAQPGQEITEGEPLMLLDLYALRMNQLTLESEAERNRCRTWDEASLLLAEEQEEDLQWMEAMIEVQGIVTSPVTGTVESVPVFGQKMEENGNLFICTDHESRPYLQWQVAEYDRYQSVKAEFPDGDDTKIVTLGVDRLTYDEGQSMYVGISYLDESIELESSLPVPCTLQTELVACQYVVPKEVVFTNEEGAPYVFVLRTAQRSYGLEYYAAKRYVTILNEDAVYFVLAAPIEEPLIVSSSEVLNDLRTVYPIQRPVQ